MQSNRKLDLLDLFEKAKQNDKNAFYQLKKLATPINPAAMNTLGLCYEYGYSTSQNLSIAFKLYLDAADLGNPIAMCNLGLAYQAGRGVRIDYTQAAYWYYECAKINTKEFNGSSRAIEQLKTLAELDPPNASALNILGVCYELGYGVKIDYQKSVNYYRSAAGVGNDTAMCNLAYAYQFGRGVETDLSQAIFWFFESAQQDTNNASGSMSAVRELEKLATSTPPNPKALIYLARCYQSGYVVPQHQRKAEDLFAQAKIRDLSQYVICDKIADYLQSNKRESTSVDEMRRTGYCLGITFMFLYATWLETQPHRLGENHLPVPRDDMSWLSSTLTKISQFNPWNRPNKEDHIQIDRFIHLMDYYQTCSKFPLGQGRIEKQFCDTKDRQIDNEYSIAAKFTFDELVDVLSKIIHEKRLIILLSHFHYVGFIKINDVYHFVDSENPDVLLQVSTINELAQRIFSGNGFYFNQPSPLAITIYNIHDKHVKEDIAYPSQESLLKNLTIFQNGSLDVTDTKHFSGYTALFRACWIGCDASVQYILDRAKGNDHYVNMKLKNGDTPLIYAALNGQLRAVQQLIAAGANVNLRDDQCESALTLAASNGHKDVVLCLLDNGATQIHSALVVSAREGHEDIVKILIQKRGNVNYLTSDKYTALNLAAKYGHYSVIKTLYKHGAKINIRTNGLLAIDLAQNNGHIHIVSLLNSYQRASQFGHVAPHINGVPRKKSRNFCLFDSTQTQTPPQQTLMDIKKATNINLSITSQRK